MRREVESSGQLSAISRKNMGRIALVPLAMLLVGCAVTKPPACDVEAGPRAYEAKAIGQEWIDYVWLELPRSPAEGTANGTAPSSARHVRWSLDAPSRGRMFVASADPVGAIVPTMIDLSCEAGPVEYAPAPVEFNVDGRAISRPAMRGARAPSARSAT